MQHTNSVVFKKFCIFGISLIASLLVMTPLVLKASCGLDFSSSVDGLIFQQTFSRNLVADGVVSDGEWVPASNPPIPFGVNWYIEDTPVTDPGPDPMGAVYALGRKNYPVNGHRYRGCFLFMLHNIENLTVEDDFDFNVFDVFSPGAADNDPPKLTIWVFNEVNNPDGLDSDWLALAELGADFSSLDDRGFLVYNHEENEYRQWLPEDGSPADGDYDWDYYWGVHALGGFNNSAYENGLPLTIDNDNELYEVFYRLGDAEMCDEDDTDLVLRRSVKDPDAAGEELIDYWKGDTGVCRPLLVEFSRPFTVVKTNQAAFIDWEIETTELDEDKIDRVELWRAPLPEGNQSCPNNPLKYAVVDQLEAVPQIDNDGNDAFCYGLRVLESGGEENWYIE